MASPDAGPQVLDASSQVLWVWFGTGLCAKRMSRDMCLGDKVPQKKT